MTIRILVTLMSVCGLLTLTGCQKANDAGDEIQDAAGEAADTVEDAAEETVDQMEEAADELDQSM